MTQWNGLTADEKDRFVGEIVEHGTEFVAPLYAFVEEIAETVRQKNVHLRAQADAAPVAKWRRNALGGIEFTVLGDPHVTDEAELFLHPSLPAAQGLSDAVTALRDAIQDMRSIGHEVPESASLVGYFCNRLKQSAATVAEPSECEICRKTGMAHSAHQPSEWVLKQAAQQQAEPVGDERAITPQGMKWLRNAYPQLVKGMEERGLCLKAVDESDLQAKLAADKRHHEESYLLSLNTNPCSIDDERPLFESHVMNRWNLKPSDLLRNGDGYEHKGLDHAWYGWMARAAQSGQRAGVAEVSREKQKQIAWDAHVKAGLIPGANLYTSALMAVEAFAEHIAAPTQQQERSDEAPKALGWINEQTASILEGGQTVCTHVSPVKTEYAQVSLVRGQS